MQDLENRVQGLGLGVQGLDFQGLGFKVYSVSFEV